MTCLCNGFAVSGTFFSSLSSSLHSPIHSVVQPQGKRCKDEWQKGHFTTSRNVLQMRELARLWVGVHILPMWLWYKSKQNKKVYLSECVHKKLSVCVCVFWRVSSWIECDVYKNNAMALKPSLTLYVTVIRCKSVKEEIFQKYMISFELKCHLAFHQILAF